MSPRSLARMLRVSSGILLGLLVGLWLLARGQPAAAPAEEEDPYFISAPFPAPLFSLTSHEGHPVSSSDFPGKLVVLFFGYTFCPDVCPLTLSNLGRAFAEMGETGERIQVLLVTVDPDRDTPERLRGYVGAFHPSFLGLTGTEAEIREVAQGFGASFNRSGEGETYTVDHTARVFVIDPQGRIALTFPVEATPSEMARDLTRLLERQP